MWISKDGDTRKQELVEAAISLYSEKGYDKTSINDIIKKVGVTKGAFYYYFKSREDILEYITLQQADAAIEILSKIADDPNISALDKLQRLLDSQTQRFLLNINTDKQIKIDLESIENTRMARKINEKVMSKAIPLLSGIVEQGIREGTFNTAFPDEVVELYINMISSFKSSVIKLTGNGASKQEKMQLLEHKVLFFQEIIEKIFGLEKGTLKLADKVVLMFKNNY